MRFLMVLLALAATPLVAGVAQAPAPSPGPAAVVSPPGGQLNCQSVGVFTTSDGLQCGGTVITLGEIHGRVFQDLLGTGVRDPSYPGIPNWVVMLNGLQTLTDASGNYAFAGVPAGTYLLCEVQRANYMQTFPPAGSTSCGIASLGYTVVLAPGQILIGLDFGNYLLF